MVCSRLTIKDSSASGPVQRLAGANRFRSLYFDRAFWHLADDEVIDFLFFATRFRCGAVDHASNNGMDPPFDEHQVFNVVGDRPGVSIGPEVPLGRGQPAYRLEQIAAGDR